MEDLIYILAGVAYLAYTFYSASKKNKKKQEQRAAEHVYEETEIEDTHSSPQEDFTKSIFDEILGVQNMDMDVEEEILGERKVEIKETVGSKPLDSVPKEEGVRTTKKVKPIEHKIDADSPIMSGDLTQEDSNEVEFDLKQAVISAEILNPPYIER